MHDGASKKEKEAGEKVWGEQKIQPMSVLSDRAALNTAITGNWD